MNTLTRRQAVAHSILVAMGIRALAPASVAAGALVEPDEGYDEAGLASPTSYTSPTHGYTVRWDPAWGVDSERVDPVLWDKLDIDRYQDIPVYTDGEHYDRLDIWLPERDARLRIIGQHVVSGVGVHTPSMGATANAASGSAVTLMVVEEAGRAVVVHRHAMNDGTTLLSYNNLVPMPDADAWLWVQLAAPEGAFRDAFERVGDDIGIDLVDYAWDGLVTVGDIVEASAAEPLVPASDVGITSATSWTDPVFGIEVTWAPTMTTYENLGRGSDASRWLNLGTKFRALVPVEVFTSDVGFEKTAEEMVNHQIENRRPEHEVLLHRIDANRGMVLTRSYLSNGSVYADYREYMVTEDGAALAITTFSAPIAGNEFPHRFGRVVGSVTVAGNQFGEFVDPAIIIAAAQSPLDPESFPAA